MELNNIVDHILENKNDLIENNSFCYQFFEKDIFDFNKLYALIDCIKEYRLYLYNNENSITNDTKDKIKNTLCWILLSSYKSLIYHYKKDDLYKINSFVFGTEDEAIEAIDLLGEAIFGINVLEK